MRRGSAAGGVIAAAVADVHRVGRDFGGRIAAVLGSTVVVVFAAGLAGEALTAAAEIQRAALRSAPGRRPWSCAVGIADGEVVELPDPARLGLVPVSGRVEVAAILSRVAGPRQILADAVTVEQATPSGGVPPEVLADGTAPATPWWVGGSRLVEDPAGAAMDCT